MTPNDDEITGPEPDADSPALGDDAFLEEFEGNESGGLGVDRKKPLVKVGLAVGGVIAILAGVILFGGKKEAPPLSAVKGPPQEFSDTPGTAPVSPAMEDALKESNQAAVEKALRESGSVLPVPITPPVGRVSMDESMRKEVEDPLARWRRIQEERQRRDEQRKKQQQLPQQAPADTTADQINALAQAMATQMQSVLEAKEIKPAQHQEIMDEEAWFEARRKKKEEEQKRLEEEKQAQLAALQGAPDGAAGPGIGTNPTEEAINILIPAATIEYGQSVIEANSDVPGPVVAQIMSGPLSGSRLLGSFEVQEEKYLTLKFNMAIVDGISHPVNAIALDPNTTLPGMATDVDKRYFSRIILPAAAKFIEGLSSALADRGGTTVNTTGTTGTTTTTTSGKADFEEQIFTGVEAAGKKIGQIIDQDASKIKPLVRVAAGTPMAIMFLEPVTDENM